MIASVPINKTWKKTIESTKAKASNYPHILKYSSRIHTAATGTKIGDTFPSEIKKNITKDDLERYYDCHRYELGKCLAVTPHLTRKVSFICQ